MRGEACVDRDQVQEEAKEKKERKKARNKHSGKEARSQGGIRRRAEYQDQEQRQDGR